MAQYIDKDSLVAEIDRRIKEVSQIKKASYEIGLFDAYKIIISFIDTLEVEEVDLETHGKELMYAIQKTHERTKREVINKAFELLTKMIVEVTYKVLEDNSVEHYDKMEFIEDFKKAIGE